MVGEAANREKDQEVGGSVGKESARSAEDLGSIPGFVTSLGEVNG